MRHVTSLAAIVILAIVASFPKVGEWLLLQLVPFLQPILMILVITIGLRVVIHEWKLRNGDTHELD